MLFPLSAVPRRMIELEYEGEILPDRKEILFKEGTRTTIDCIIRPPYPPFDDAVRPLLFVCVSVCVHVHVRVCVCVHAHVCMCA